MLTSISTVTNIRWDFFNPVRIEFGCGSRAGLLTHVQGRRVLVVASRRGRQQLLNDPILGRALLEKCVLHWIDTVVENPTLVDLEYCINQLAGSNFDIIIGFGGGSAIDAAKVIRLALHPDCQKYSLAQLIASPELRPDSTNLSLYAIPTTAGTGSEVTPFATVWDQIGKRKLSLASHNVFPSASFVDPELTENAPLPVAISTGLDAINQALESIWSKNANPITVAYATSALRLGFPALNMLADGLTTLQLRTQMSEASLLAGLAISHTRTAICHSISYPLTAHFGVSHGLACAFTMPAVLEFNLKADDGRFAQLAKQWLGTADTGKLLEKFETLNANLGVREAIKIKISNLSDLLALEGQMRTGGRSNNNFIEIEDISKLLIKAWG